MATVTLAVSGDADQNLYTYVDDKIVPEFEKLSSVGEVSIAGGQDSYTRVELIPEKLAQYHLNMNTVAQLVGAADFTIRRAMSGLENRISTSVSATNLRARKV